MIVNKRILTLSALFILLVSTFSAMSRFYASAQLPQATLTGNILDHGVDTNGNGLYDYLEVDVEVNVTVAGNFQVRARGLVDQFDNFLPVFNYSQGFLDAGVQYLNLSFFGPAIFGSRLNPQKVSSIELDTGDYMSMYLGSIYNVALSRVYSYNEFDPYAFLTGRISDRGVDSDGDGLFNYLEVGIEFNVTQAGEYRVSAQGLMEKSVIMTNYLSDYHYEEGNFTPGVHTVYMNFSGSEISSKHFNPTNLSYISIYDNINYVETSHLDAAPLSTRYSYTLFNAPSKDIQVNFKVYPDATVAVDGTLNFTHMYPENTYGPRVNATVGFSTTGNLTTETATGTVVFPENPSLNYNAIEAHSRTFYENGLLSATVNASTILPPYVAEAYPFNSTDVSLNAAYSGGMFDVAIMGQTLMPTAYSTVFPFNMSDVTVRADFDGTIVRGNITFHAIGGFPLTDVTLDFSGNRSSLSFTGNVNITYASYGGFQINETSLDQLLTDLTGNITGQGPGSLYNMTGGYLECTQLNAIKTPWPISTLGADVEFSATVIGNFTGAIARMLFLPGSPAEELQQFAYASMESAVTSVRNASLVLSYYHGSQIAQVDIHLTSDVQALWNSVLLLAPPAMPPYWSSQKTQIEAWLKIANATAYALTDAGLNASYSSAERRISLSARLSANASQLKNDILPVLPDAVPPIMHDPLESYLNTTYCTLTSSTATLDMVNGTANFASTATLQGDFEAEVNHEKLLLIAAMSPSYPIIIIGMSSEPMVPWMLRLLNETEININNFQAEFELGQDRMYANFSGMILKPQPDNVDVITFKLKKWLDLTTDPNAPPLDFEKFSVTVTGESNANQTVLLFQPSDVPAPDHFSGDYRSMSWNNASLSSLKDLTFLLAYQKQISYGGGNYDIPILTNSTVTSLVFDPSAKQITFNVTGPPGTGFCNVTIPKNLLNATAISDWAITFDGKTLTSGEFNITENAEYVFVYLNYTHSEHVISISGTWVVAEFQPDILPLALIIPLVIAAIIAVKQRRKLEPIKTKFLQTLARARLSLKPS